MDCPIFDQKNFLANLLKFADLLNIVRGLFYNIC